MQVPKLKEIRYRRALSQRELAALAGVSPVTVARLETSGLNAHPSTVRRLAKALEVPVEDLLGLAETGPVAAASGSARD